MDYSTNRVVRIPLPGAIPGTIFADRHADLQHLRRMKYIISLIVFCTLAASCVNRDPDKSPAKATGERTVWSLSPSDSVRSDTVDFGRIHQGEVIRKEFYLHNASDKPLLILSASANCGCTAVDFTREPIKPGENGDFSFEFDSRGFVGYQLKQIKLRTTLSSAPYILVVTGEVESNE